MSAIWADQLRALARKLSDNGKKEVTTRALCEALGVTDINGKALVRRSITHIVRHGEFERIAPGVFLWRGDVAGVMKRDGERFRRMWRIIRTEKAGWQIADVAAITRLHQATVASYCRWLEKEGYLKICGKRGNARLFRATDKAFRQRETPYPPSAPEDPYGKERSAAARLVRMFMEPNPAICRDKIITECQAIIARFEQEEDYVEQSN